MPRKSILTQRVWRTIGALSLTTCAVMGIYGARINPLDSLRFFAVYWAVFLLFLLITLWMALIDFRHIRLRARAEERRIFLETLGDEGFRKTLRDSHEPPAKIPRKK